MRGRQKERKIDNYIYIHTFKCIVLNRMNTQIKPNKIHMYMTRDKGRDKKGEAGVREGGVREGGVREGGAREGVD